MLSELIDPRHDLRFVSVGRELQYDEEERGSYVLFFRHNKKLAVDATAEDGSLGRLINHASRDEANLIMKVHVVEGSPRVVFVASKTIKKKDHLCYFYGETRRDVVARLPWLR